MIEVCKWHEDDASNNHQIEKLLRKLANRLR